MFEERTEDDTIIMQLQFQRLQSLLTAPFHQKIKQNRLLLSVPVVKLDCTQQNFVFKSIEIWNDVWTKIFEKCHISNSGLIIPGSSRNSDMSVMSASLGAVKHNLKSYLLSNQKLDVKINWQSVSTEMKETIKGGKNSCWWLCLLSRST